MLIMEQLGPPNELQCYRLICKELAAVGLPYLSVYRDGILDDANLRNRRRTFGSLVAVTRNSRLKKRVRELRLQAKVPELKPTLLHQVQFCGLRALVLQNLIFRSHYNLVGLLRNHKQKLQVMELRSITLVTSTHQPSSLAETPWREMFACMLHVMAHLRKLDLTNLRVKDSSGIVCSIRSPRNNETMSTDSEETGTMQEPSRRLDGESLRLIAEGMRAFIADG